MCFSPHDPDHRTPRHQHKVTDCHFGAETKHLQTAVPGYNLNLPSEVLYFVSVCQQAGHDVYSSMGYGAIVCLFISCRSVIDSSVHWSFSFVQLLPNEI